MERCCSRCGASFDDEQYMMACPHYTVHGVIALPVTSESLVDELIAYELSELYQSQIVTRES